jgi:hypothetical protein
MGGLYMKFRDESVSTNLSRCDNATVRAMSRTQNARISEEPVGPASSGPTFRSLLTIGFFTITIALSNAAAQRGPVPVPLPTLIDNGTQLVSFVCGGPLNAEEKQRIARYAQATIKQFAENWYRNDVIIRQDMKAVRENPGVISAETWEKWRLAFALAPPDDVEAQIIEAHDPTVVRDREHQLVITEHSLQNLYSAAAWAAQQSGGASPGAGYVVRMRNIIKQRYTSWPEIVRASYAHIVRDLAGTKEYLPVVSATLRNNLFVAWRGDNFADPEHATQMVSQLSDIYKLDVQERARLLMEAQNGTLHSLVKADPNRRH